MSRKSRRGGRKPSKRASRGPEYTGLVIEMYGLEAVLRPEEGEGTIRALLRKSIARRPGLVVGDRVFYQELEEDATNPDAPGAIIVKVDERKNLLTRPDFHGHPKAIASNLDFVVIVVTPNQPPLRLGLIDRYLAACYNNEIAPMICLNKGDLPESDEAWEELAVYRDLDIPMVRTSALGEGEGIGPLGAAIKGKRSIFVGHSGVGKSSLACQLIPGLVRRVGEVNEQIGRGRHTTTSSRLLDLPESGELVDTPGIRSFGICGVEPRQLALLYPEFLPFEGTCRFRGCTHIHEPGCTVRQALEEGEIDPGRYERYCQIYESLVLGE